MIVDKGYIDAPIEEGTDLRKEIERLKKEKNAIILGHYYQRDEVQEISDFVGDSLALAQKAAQTDADIIVSCGVNFMGETAKILSPSKKVLVPDLNAGCSLADSCKAEDLQAFIEANPGHIVISYANTTAEVKALTDVIVTSSNACQIVESFPKDQKIIFGPDRNLGNYINSVTGRNMKLWDGACIVHEKFSVEKLVTLKKQYPEAKVLAHAECKKSLLLLADFIGSTKNMIDYAKNSDCRRFIVVTESGILYEMRKTCPDKEFIPAPPDDSTCACNECHFMRLNTLEKIYNCLKYEQPEIVIDKELCEKAVRPIDKMLEISRNLGLIK